MLSGCEVVAEVVTAPIFIAAGIKESCDRRQTEKEEGHPYGETGSRKRWHKKHEEAAAGN
jgi:hypothetical protein